jgi:hypothetical protein
MFFCIYIFLNYDTKVAQNLSKITPKKVQKIGAKKGAIKELVLKAKNV